MQIKWQCEIDPYCRAVLRHHWPDIPCYEDIREVHGLPVGSVRSGAKLSTAAWPVDLICGGFPCQPVSLAGKGLAQEDPRWLWPEFARVVGELRPYYVLVENVPGLVKRGLDLVVTGLAEMGYDAEWQIVSAASVGAPHLRERIILVAANTDASGQHGFSVNAEMAGASESMGNTKGKRLPSPLLQWQPAGGIHAPHASWWASEPSVGRVADGVPNRVAQLRALGNAVVPQVAEAVGRMILAAA
jgi:DNA (cytosine-5)-methyltransferase 1